MLSEEAWLEGMFPRHYFDDNRLLIADVNNRAIWYLLHQITRATYRSVLDEGVTLRWKFVAADLHAGVWDLIMLRPQEESVVIHTLWHGNNAFETNGLGLEHEEDVDYLTPEMHAALLQKLRGQHKSNSTAAVTTVKGRLGQEQRIRTAMERVFDEAYNEVHASMIMLETGSQTDNTVTDEEAPLATPTTETPTPTTTNLSTEVETIAPITQGSTTVTNTNIDIFVT